MFLFAGVHSVVFLVLSNSCEERGKVVGEEFPRKIEVWLLVVVFCVLYGIAHDENRTC